MKTTTLFFFILIFLLKDKSASCFSLNKTKLLKAILPFCIIVHHICLYYNIYTDFSYFGSYTVGLFFFMSGYGLEYKLEHSIDKSLKLLKRLSNILIPTICPIIFYLILKLVISDNFNMIHYIKESLLERTLILPFSWFIINLSIFYIVFTISICMSKNTPIELKLGQIKIKQHHIILLILLSIITLSYRMDNWGTWYHFSNGAFFVGTFYKCNEQIIVNFLNKNYSFLILCVLMVICLFFYRHPVNYSSYFNICLYSLIIVMLLSKCSDIDNVIISFFSKISYELYLCQGISFLVVGHYFKGNPYIASIMIVFLTIGIAWICRKLRVCKYSDLIRVK